MEEKGKSRTEGEKERRGRNALITNPRWSSAIPARRRNERQEEEKDRTMGTAEYFTHFLPSFLKNNRGPTRGGGMDQWKCGHTFGRREMQCTERRGFGRQISNGTLGSDGGGGLISSEWREGLDGATWTESLSFFRILQVCLLRRERDYPIFLEDRKPLDPDPNKGEANGICQMRERGIACHIR